MQTKHAYNDFPKISLWNDAITSFYILAFLIFLYYSNELPTGKCFDSYYTVLGLATAEVIKYTIHALRNKSLVRKSNFKNFLKNIIVVTALFVIVYVVAVLFGAPVFSQFQETTIFSLITAIITALPTCMYLGSESTVNMFLSLTSYEADNIHRLFMLKIRLTLFGAWLGAFVIPLDWNRPWQNWPIPCCVGTLLGYAVGNCTTAFLQFKNKKVYKKTGKYTL